MDDTREAMYKQRVKGMAGRISILERVLKLTEVINSTLEQAPLLDVIIEVATQLTDTESASVMLIDEQTGGLHFVAVSGQNSATVKPVPVPMEGSIAGMVAQENRPCLIRDAQTDPRWCQDVDQASGFITKSIIAVPLQLQGSVIGVVEAVNKLNGAEMSWDDVEILSMVATQAAIAIHNAKLLSELQTAYDELNELDSMKSEFISIAAHELRTPLSLVLGYAAFLKEDSSGQAREQAEAVLQSAMRLRSLIDDMISLREIDTGEAALELERVSIQDLITAAIREIGYIAEAKEQEIALSQPTDPVIVEVDRNKMVLVIVNLISNAIKFTGHRGQLGVLAGTKDDAAWLTVWDTGIGIPEDELDRIFDRFYQVENSLTRHYEGMGLGLSIIREMVELHQGNIKVESHVGKGSAFTVTIPMSQSG